MCGMVCVSTGESSGEDLSGEDLSGEDLSREFSREFSPERVLQSLLQRVFSRESSPDPPPHTTPPPSPLPLGDSLIPIKSLSDPRKGSSFGDFTLSPSLLLQSCLFSTSHLRCCVVHSRCMHDVCSMDSKTTLTHSMVSSCMDRPIVDGRMEGPYQWGRSLGGRVMVHRVYLTSVSHECISRVYLTSVASEGHEHYE